MVLRRIVRRPVEGQGLVGDVHGDDRPGHSSTRAAMIYHHATGDRDEAIAKALGGLMHQVRSEAADQVGEGI